MNPLHDLFGLVCHQDVCRSFKIAGMGLPFCQRCTGLYLGLGIGLLIQLISGSHKRGLPPRDILYTTIACLLIMPVFGFHFLDPGPAWRFWTGLIYGNAIAYLLLPAAFIITTRGGKVGEYTLGSVIMFWGQFAFVNLLALWFPVQSTTVAYVVLALACLGVLGVVLCLAVCLLVVVQTSSGHFFMKGNLHGLATLKQDRSA